jgi:hypothetical protein
MRHALFEIDTLAHAAKMMTGIPATTEPDHEITVGRLVVLIDVLAGMASGALQELRVRLATLPH